MRYSIVLVILLFIASVFLNSCNDFLNKAPLDKVTNKTYWNTETDLKNYNNSIYLMSKNSDAINIGNEEETFNRWFMDMWSDNVAGEVANDLDKVKIKTGHYTILSTPRTHGWKGWNLVREINVGLENYDKADISQEIINKYKAEARFFRAWFYSDKVEFFGAVPWVGKPLNVDSEELFAKRMPREQAMDSVLADINFAVKNLPERWPGAPTTASTGRFNKWHALLIKSRLCLFEGTWRKYHGGSNPNMWLKEASDAAERIIKDGPYNIYSTGHPKSDYRSVSTVKNLDLTGNSEVMYWRDYEVGIATNYTLVYWQDSNGATKDFVDDYLLTNGKPPVTKEGINPLYEGDQKIEDVFKNRDPRMRQTILHPEDAEKYDYYPAFDQPQLVGSSVYKATSTGYTIIKYFNRSMVDAARGQGTTPAVIMRYNEVLLNYAEAKAELGMMTQSDLDRSINKLRDRVGMPHLQLDNVPDDPRYNTKPIITEIRRERRIELFAEGFRYLDLMRWKQGTQLAQKTSALGIQWNEEAKKRYPDTIEQSSAIKDPITGKTKRYIDVYEGSQISELKFDESKNYLWPIPLSALSQNENLKQNPGW